MHWTICFIQSVARRAVLLTMLAGPRWRSSHRGRRQRLLINGNQYAQLGSRPAPDHQSFQGRAPCPGCTPGLPCLSGGPTTAYGDAPMLTRTAASGPSPRTSSSARAGCLQVFRARWNCSVGRGVPQTRLLGWPARGPVAPRRPETCHPARERQYQKRLILSRQEHGNTIKGPQTVANPAETSRVLGKSRLHEVEAPPPSRTQQSCFPLQSPANETI